ncbi:hypothetical protein PSR59_00915 [Ligilactobacillus ruminis]|uniref:Uncharacterized protein n=1 Tax=Ligilactobacillus ruminis TaxID=1623 RepID=A0AAQ2XKZ9_9LACO|nr:hypothetical protein [Ligilactobacillus ruminis]WDC82235.1 hypothetical protein PSR59_00915 [Ligilactobacillus ruminis]
MESTKKSLSVNYWSTDLAALHLAKYMYQKMPDKSSQSRLVIMPFEYTGKKENLLYAWRAFSYGKKIEIFC